MYCITLFFMPSVKPSTLFFENLSAIILTFFFYFVSGSLVCIESMALAFEVKHTSNYTLPE